MKSIIEVLLLLACLNTAWTQERITDIRFPNLRKTDPDYLQKFLIVKTGAFSDSAQIQHDVQMLRNLQLFSDVSYSLRDTTGGQVLTFHCQELATLLPIGNFGGVRGNFWFQVGAHDFNWLGQGNTLGGYYRYYDRHSFEGYLKFPHINGTRWGISLSGNRLATIEPALIESQYVSFNTDRWSAIALGRYALSQHLWLEFGGGYIYERYEKNLNRSEANAPGPELAEFNKYLLKSVFTVDRVDYFFQYLSGFSNELTVETVLTKGEDDAFWKILNIGKYYARLGERGNTAFRFRSGLSQNKDSPFVPFVLDNYITVRGSGNRVSRGTAEFTVNAEYRHSLLEKKWGAIQGVGFLDWSTWRPAGGSFSGMFDKENNVTFAGVGMRVYFRRIYNLVLRVDYGISVTDTEQQGIVFGTGHYF